MIKYYKLDGKMVVQAADLLEWAAWIETADRRVALDEIDGIKISTIFLTLDHNFSVAGLQGRADPLLFETTVFMPDGEIGDMNRYFTWGEAEEGHKKIAELIKAQLADAEFLTKDALHDLMRKIKE
jgi:hypothetical protein